MIILALVALVWPYSEEKTLDPFRADTLNYFESLSPNRPTLLKVLDKLAKRLLIKNKSEQVIPVYFRLIEITNDIERRTEIIEHFYEVLRKSKKFWPHRNFTRCFDRYTDSRARRTSNSNRR